MGESLKYNYCHLHLEGRDYGKRSERSKLYFEGKVLQDYHGKRNKRSKLIFEGKILQHYHCKRNKQSKLNLEGKVLVDYHCNVVDKESSE